MGGKGRIVAVLVLMVLLLGHVRARMRPESERLWPERALLQVTGPIERTLHSLVGGVRGIGTRYVVLVGVEEENSRLREDLRTHERLRAELAETAAENERLRALVRMRTHQQSPSVAAAVVGRNTTGRYRSLRIDRGHRDGLKPGHAVIAAEGAVGTILRASAEYADVLLLTDSLAAAGAVVQRSRLRGVASGDGGEGLQLGFIARSDQAGVRAGDAVVTSGEDAVFPPALPIGRVATVGVAKTGLFLEIGLKPAVPLDHVEEVLVIVDDSRGPYGLGQGPDLPPDESTP